MNDHDPTNAKTERNEARADRARQRLADDLRDMTQVGQAMLKRTGRLGLGALVGVAALGLIALGVAIFRRRRNPLSRYMLAKEPSFFNQAVRTVVLSLLGVFATRIARRLPLPVGPAAPAE